MEARHDDAEKKDIAAVKARLKVKAALELFVITITGGMEQNSHENFVYIGDVILERAADEPIEDFQARGKATAIIFR